MRARLLGSIVLMFALALPALAQDRRGGSSLDRVLPYVRQTVPGRFYDAEGPYFGPNGHPTYRLKWMTPDGRIIWFGVDAETGRVLGGMPSGRYRDEDERGGWGNRPHDNWPDNGGGGWGNGGGWGGRGGGGRGDHDGQGGWSGRGGYGGDGRGDHDGQGGWRGRGGGDGGGGRGDRGDQGGWGGRGGNGDGQSDRGGQSGPGGRGAGHGGNDRGGAGGRHRPHGG